MPEYRLIDNRRKEAEYIADMSKKLDAFSNIFLKKLADEIVARSPVDTGTYMEGHQITSGRKQPAATDSSHGKPRNQSYGTFASAATQKLHAEIDSLPPGSEAFVSNTAVHAKIVEYGGSNWRRGPYAVYRGARSKSASFAAEAARKAKSL